MTEFATIRVQRFRDPQGRPTCSAGAHNGQSCVYLGARMMGFVSMCLAPRVPQDLMRAPTETSHLRPHDRCPVWADQGPA